MLSFFASEAVCFKVYDDTKLKLQTQKDRKHHRTHTFNLYSCTALCRYQQEQLENEWMNTAEKRNKLIRVDEKVRLLP